MSSPSSTPDVGQLIDIGDDTENNTDQTHIEEVKGELERTRKQLDEALSEVAVAQVLQENLTSVERQKTALEEELATMQILLSEATQDSQSNVINHLKKKYSEVKSENQDLRVQLNLLESGGGAGPTGTSRQVPDGESLLGVTKNLAKRVRSSVQSSVIPERGLDENMARAREGAEVLREIVMPLEEQIVALKGKLRETDSLLQEYEARQSRSLLEMEAVAAWLAGGDKQEVETKLVAEVGDGYSGGEGELYHAMLAARIGMLVQALEASNWEKEEAVKELEGERRKATGLREQVERMQGVVALSREQVSRLGGQVTEQQVVESSRGTVGERVITPGEWEVILARLDCRLATAETQTEGADRQELSLMTQERDHLRENCSKYKEDLRSEAAFRKEMEATWNLRGEQFKSEVSAIEEKLRVAEQTVEKCNSAYIALAESARRDLGTLSKDREKIVKELRRLQAENDGLVGRHSVLSEQMASEVINLPDSMEDMQLLLLTYREDLIAAKLGKERAEERLRNDVGILKSQLVGEQQSRLGQERQMKGEIQVLHSKVGTLEEVRGELAREKDRRRTVEEERRRLEARQEEASKEKEQQAAVAASQSSGLSAEVTALKSKISSLQLDLDNSVAVQNDFVRLSQSLQVELEKIRQAETEVRWQHEEDVEECNNCRQQFSVTRRKHHCRHCGRIFCTDCVTKQVGSGPAGRMSRVCDVCHTLLSHHSAPYFSYEAPAMPE